MKLRFSTKIALVLCVLVLLFATLCSTVFAVAVPQTPAEYTRTGSRITNEYLTFHFDSSGDRTFYTVAGDPHSSTDNNKRLLYGDLGNGTSYTYVNINGNTYAYSASNNKLNADSSSMYSSATYGNVVVEQIISFVYNTATQREDIVEFKYVFTNIGSTNQTAGARIMFDTMLGGNDSAPFRIPGVGDVTREREFTGTAIPATWQAFDSLTNPTVVASGTFYNNVLERPDKVQFIHWQSANDQIYNCSITGQSFGDSAVNVYYDPDTLAPGESRTVRTFYGLSAFTEPDVPEGELDLRVIAPPAQLEVDPSTGTTYENNPFTLNTWVTNGTFSAMSDLTLSIELPEGLELVGQQPSVSIASLASGAERNISWYIMATPQYENTTLDYSLTLSGDGIDDIVKEFSIYLPKIACDHVEGDWIVDEAATCEDAGYRHTECTECGERIKAEILPAIGHSFVVTENVAATCTTDGYTLYECQREGCSAEKRQTVFAYGHTFGDDNVCDDCDYIVIVHTHSFTTNVVAPNCTQVGYTQYTCTCGYSYRDNYLDQLGHAWDEGTVTVEKTCTTAGVKLYTCTVCDAYYNETLLAGHEWTEIVAIDATCTTDGSVTRVCDQCDKTETDIIPAAHQWNEGVEISPATCTESGVKECTCLACGATEQFDIAVLGHHFVNGSCTRCDATIPDIIRPVTDHPLYGMYFEIDDILSNYGPDLINEYGVLLDYNEDANIKKVGVYLTQDGTMWRRCIACTGDNIDFATYVPYLSYGEDIKYTGLNSAWINTFGLRENSDGIWCYSNYATIGVNLEDKYGNLLLSLYDIGQAGAKTRVFDDLDEMIAWLKEDEPIDPEDPELPFPIIPIGPSVTVDDVTACVGQTVTVDVTLTGFDPIKSILLDPAYDEDILELVSGIWLTRGMVCGDWSAEVGNAVNAFTSATDINGAVLRLTFKVKDTAAPRSVADISFDFVVIKGFENGEEYDMEGTVEAGSVTVGHVYSSDWTSDDATHWHACTMCGAKKDEAAHGYIDACDTTCNTCEYVRVAPHDYKTAWDSNEDTHWHECSLCGDKKDEAEHGYTDVCDTTCNVCEYVRVAPHDYKTTWDSNEDTHWHECSLCGDKKDEASHSFDNSCDTDCNVCGHTRAASHNYGSEWLHDADTHWHECANCNDKTDIGGHVWNDGELWGVDLATGIGTKTFTCTECNATKDETVTAYRVVVDNKYTYVNRTVRINISFAEILSAKSLMVYDLVYDTEALELIGAEWNTSTSPVIANFDMAELIGTVAFENNTSLSDVVLTLTFKVLPAAMGGNYTIDGDIVVKEMVGEDEKTVDAVLVPGSISVCPYLRGDVNGDGRVDSDDAIHLLRYTLLPSYYPINQDGDMDGNGTVDSDDAIHLLRHTLLPEYYPLAPLD